MFPLTDFGEIAGRDCGVWNQLGRGRAILSSTEELDQYLYSYGPMTKSQWGTALGDVSVTPETTQVIDYGCGQGLACSLFFDHFGSELVNSIAKVVLIEPSLPALTRAASVIKCYSDDIEVVTLNKKLGDLAPEELTAGEGVFINHLFSNVLDIDGFCHLELFTKMFWTKGHHGVLAVSHDRNFYGGSARFKELEEAIGNPDHKDWFSVVESDVKQFQCGNGQPAISWHLQVEVLRT